MIDPISAFAVLKTATNAIQEAVKVGKDLTFGSLFKQTVIDSLEDEVMNAFQEKFESATVNFNENEKSQPILPVEKPASLTDKYTKDSMEDLIQGKDVIVNKDKDIIVNRNPTLEEKDGKVQTRVGNVKVKRVG